MRRVAALIFGTVLASLGAHAEGYGPSLTVLLDFQEAASPESVAEMQREVRQLLEPAGYVVDVRLSSAVRPNDTFSDLVLVKFKGSCSTPQDPMLLDERGPAPFAFAHTADGRVQPFGEVACPSVRRAVEAALWGGQRNNREPLFGRALGRVVAHELFHILGNTGQHGKSGVFSPSLSGAQLISEHLEFSSADRDRLRQARYDGTH